MGISTSKSADNAESAVEGTLPSTPIVAPQIRRLELDPRSPSSDIARTPIEVLRTPLMQSVVNSVNNSRNISENLDDSGIAVAASVCPDPRSPTTEFHRTPVVTEVALKAQAVQLHNKNLDNARLPVFAITPAKQKKPLEKISRKIYNEMTNNPISTVSPKLLESSPITVKLPEKKRNSVVGLLETNLDFVETDLDEVIQNKTKELELSSNASGMSFAPEKAAESLTIVTEAIVKETVAITEDEVSTAESVSDCETPSSVATAPPVSQLCEVPAYDTLLQVPDETNKVTDVLDTKTRSSIDELDRKLTNLIYEDKQSENSPKVIKMVGNHRTPLGDRNSNSQQRKSIPVLKVSDKPTKSVGMSKIPVFKEKRGKAKVNMQCENTPPRVIPKQSQWSTEDSFII